MITVYPLLQMVWFVLNCPDNDVPMQVTAAVEVCVVDVVAAATETVVLTTADVCGETSPDGDR